MPLRLHNKHWLVLNVLSALLSIALVACNMPGRSTPPPSGYEMINTAAARTVAAQLTDISRPPVATAGSTHTPVTTTASASETQVTPAPSQPPALTVVPQPTKAPQAGDCDRAKFVIDITVPDNTELQPGESFTKTWRLKNVGQCTWGEDYQLVFVGGERLGAQGETTLPKVVRSNATVDVSVDMIAPSTGGTFRSEWKLRNADGEIFGTGAKGNLPIWAQIRVNAPAGSGAGAFDFVSSGSSASWYSAAGDSAGTPLAFGGSPDDPNGAALLADQVRLESGQTSGKVLLLVPMQQEDGYVYGVFPSYQVQSGDHFKARVGFAVNSNGNCGAGKAIFQIAVKQGEDIQTLQEIPAACDGGLTPIDLNLGSLRGQTVEFILAVRADGSPQDDWAVWNSPQIFNK